MGDREEFRGNDPNYGKVPWFRIALLVFLIFITWAAVSSGASTGATISAGFIVLQVALLRGIVQPLTLKKERVYFVLSSDGLSYLDPSNTMSPIAWKEMIRFETVAGERPLLKLCWRGHRGDKEVFAWFDKLMTRLTGKMHKGGVPFEESASVERSVVLEPWRQSSNGANFGDRFSARFAQNVQSLGSASTARAW